MTERTRTSPIPFEIEGDAFDDAHRAAGGGVAGLVTSIADLIGLHAGAKAVFGEPVEQHGRTVIPVAQTIIGAGGGSGESDEDGSGSGAGSGALTRPIGYIEIREDTTEFVPLRRPWQDPTLWVAASVSLFVASRAIRALVRR